MMKFKTNSFLFMMLCATALNSWAGYYNTIDIDGVSIHLDKDKAGYVNVHDDQLNTDYSCKIENWNDSLISGAGGISLTSDHLGVLLASGNKYLDVKELIDCKGQSIRIHSIHYFNNSISSRSRLSGWSRSCCRCCSKRHFSCLSFFISSSLYGKPFLSTNVMPVLLPDPTEA